MRDKLYMYMYMSGFYTRFFAGGGGEMIELQLVNFNDILEVYEEKNRCIPL